MLLHNTIYQCSLDGRYRTCYLLIVIPHPLDHALGLILLFSNVNLPKRSLWQKSPLNPWICPRYYCPQTRCMILAIRNTYVKHLFLESLRIELPSSSSSPAFRFVPTVAEWTDTVSSSSASPSSLPVVASVDPPSLHG